MNTKIKRVRRITILTIYNILHSITSNFQLGIDASIRDRDQKCVRQLAIEQCEKRLIPGHLIQVLMQRKFILWVAICLFLVLFGFIFATFFPSFNRNKFNSLQQITLI